MSLLASVCRSARSSRPLALLRPLVPARTLSSAAANGPAAASDLQSPFNPLRPGVPTTADCIPIDPPYALASLMSPAAPLSEPTLRKLHQLAHLPYPSSVTATSLQDLIGVVDSIRSERVRRLLYEGETVASDPSDRGWGKKEIVFDGTREHKLVDEAVADAAQKGVEAQGRDLLRDAKKTAGGIYYTVRSRKTG